MTEAMYDMLAEDRFLYDMYFKAMRLECRADYQLRMQYIKLNWLLPKIG